MFEWSIPSMKAIYNSRIINKESVQISTNNRAFCYGDGLFETIVTGPNRINLIDGHMGRLMAHSDILKLKLPDNLTDKFKEWIKDLSTLNKITGDVRAKIQVWRKSGGLYSPLNHEAEFLITVDKTEKPIFSSLPKIGIAQSMTNQFSKVSIIKSVSALNYVMVGIEKTSQEVDDLIILDSHGHLSETHISNLFWTKGNQVYTPSLTSGCVSGVMRSFILDFFKNDLNQPIHEVLEGKSALNDCDSIFSSNASGITYFERLIERKNTLVSPEELIKPLIKRLQRP